MAMVNITLPRELAEALLDAAQSANEDSVEYIKHGYAVSDYPTIEEYRTYLKAVAKRRKASRIAYQQINPTGA